MLEATRRGFLGTATALATSACAGSQRAPMNEPSLRDVRDELSALIPDCMRRHNLPGVSLALARNREIVWAEAYGVADKATNRALSAETVFEAASLSKPVYAYAVLKLADQGAFALDRPLVDYLGRDLNPAEPRFRQVTAAHVLSHTSGIEPQPGESRPPVLVFTPGERFEYSPHAFDILQLAVERAVGEPIAPMMERMVLRPFGMSRSAWGWSEEYANFGARGYTAEGERDQTFNEQVWRLSAEERARVLTPYPFESVPNAAAGLHTTPSDYARFLLEAIGRDESGFHLSRRMQRQMLTPHARVAEFETLSWGVGFGLQHPSAGPPSCWHWGDWGIFQHYAVAYEGDGAALVVMTNSRGLGACREIAQAALRRDQPAFDWLMG